MRDYLGALQAMVEELKANKLIRVNTLKLTPASSEDRAKVDAMVKAHGKAVEPVAAFYSQVASMHVEWEVISPPEHVTEDENFWQGAINIWSIDKIFLYPEVQDDEEDHPFRRVGPFDNFIIEACTCLYPIPGKPTIAYHYFGEQLETTGIDFDGWFDRLLVSRGWLYWVKSLTPAGASSFEVKEMREGLPKIFKDPDMSLFQPGKGARTVY